ncbi:NADase-type glycan-binding domain-containing protein [Streptomyces sp. NPDC055299]
MATDHTTCPDCGAPAPQTGQSFCDSCGAFLRWDRPTTPTTPTTPPSTPPAPAPPAPPASSPSGPPPDAARAHPATSGPDDTPVRPAAPNDAVRPDAGTPSPLPHQAGDEDPTTPLPATDGDGAAPPRPAPTHAPPGERKVSETGIRALLVPVPDAVPTAPPEAPGGVLPGRPDAARPRVRTPHAAPEPVDGTPCPTCAKPNAPGRHFCHSCATPLTHSTRPEAEGPYAGERPRLHRDRTRWVTRAVVAAALAAVVVGGIIGGPPAARAVQDHFADRVQVPAATWKASHSGPEHGAKLAFDTYSNTWWGTGYSGASDGQYLEAGFGQPTDLLNLVITPGASPRTPQAADPARPHEFDVLVTDSAGKQHLSHYRLNDGGPQNIDVHVRDALTVRLILHSAYGATDKKQVAIAELEFFARSGS